MDEPPTPENRRRAPARQRAAYGIGVVASLTGVPAETLRIWERRYGVPRPARTAGGSRVYGDDEVARLKLVARALAAGHRAGKVVGLGRRALERLVSEAVGEGGADPVTAAPTAESCLRALRAEDPASLRVLLRRAALLLGPVRFVEELARPLAERAGACWARGEIEVRQEHLLTECLSTQLRVVLAGLEGAETAPVVVLATFPGELHALGLDMAALHIAARGGVPRLLGPSCPPREIAAAARAYAAGVIGVSMSAGASPSACERHLGTLLAAIGRAPTLVWLGGARAASVRSSDPRVRVVDSLPALERALEEARRVT